MTQNLAQVPVPSDSALSAEDLHRILLRSYRLGNAARVRFMEALLALSESRLYLSLGFSSVAQYSERFFGHQKSETYELLRVAKALPELPRSAAAFGGGEVSWSALREISRVAKNKTEGEWLDFAKEKPLKALQAEARDAVSKNRPLPRKGKGGLPDFLVKFTFELSMEEHERISLALRKASSELSRSLGVASPAEVRPQDALLYLAERILETEPSVAANARAERDEPVNTVVYHLCPGCRQGSVATPAGPVEVAPERMEQVELGAKAVVIDRPTPPALAFKVLARDGLTCANPLCGRRLGLQAHHVVHRSKGGRTEIDNETALCSTCHGLHHIGRLAIESDRTGGLSFVPRAMQYSTAVESDLRELLESPRISVQVPVEVPTAEKGASLRTDRLEKALRRLGYGAAETRERLGRAMKEIRERGGALLEGEVMRAACRG